MLETNLVCDRCRQSFMPIRLSVSNNKPVYSRLVHRMMNQIGSRLETATCIPDKYIDLCPKCESEFLDFMDMKKEEN